MNYKPSDETGDPLLDFGGVIPSLNEEFGVDVVAKLNAHGLVRVGHFPSHEDAEEYAKRVREMTSGGWLPKNYNPIWPYCPDGICVDVGAIDYAER